LVPVFLLHNLQQRERSSVPSPLPLGALLVVVEMGY
jgi:hypothetical protein